MCSAHFEQLFQHGRAQPSTPMCRRKPDLVDPQLRQLIGMDVMDARSKTDDQPIVDGNNDVMPGIARNSLVNSMLMGLSKTSRATFIRMDSSPRCKTLIAILIASPLWYEFSVQDHPNRKKRGGPGAKELRRVRPSKIRLAAFFGLFCNLAENVSFSFISKFRARDVRKYLALAGDRLNPGGWILTPYLGKYTLTVHGYLPS